MIGFSFVSLGNQPEAGFPFLDTPDPRGSVASAFRQCRRCGRCASPLLRTLGAGRGPRGQNRNLGSLDAVPFLLHFRHGDLHVERPQFIYEPIQRAASSFGELGAAMLSQQFSGLLPLCCAPAWQGLQ